MTAPASPEEALEAIEARAAKATDGPWRACTCGKCGQVWSTSADACVASAESLHDCPEGEGFTRAQSLVNAAFIAAAREDVPALCAEVRRLQSLLGRFAASAIASANNAQSIWLAQDDWDELRKLAALAPVATGTGESTNGR